MIDKLNRIIALRREVNGLCRQIERETGVTVIGNTEEIQLYRGMEKVEAALGVTADEYVWYRSPRKDIVTEGYKIIQLSESDDSNIYREALHATV